MQKLTAYNIRVYGILRNDRGEVLLSKENGFGKTFTKFPGGGHELGEGIQDTVIREFQEELRISIEVKEHFYTTDFFQVSAFDDREQLISIYYLVSSNEVDTIENRMKSLDEEAHNSNFFFWKKLDELTKDDVTYPIDQLVVEKLIEKKQKS